MPYERNQTLCDCGVYGAFCHYDGKPPGGAKCMARDDWYTRLCTIGECPGMPDPRCCGRCEQPEEQDE